MSAPVLETTWSDFLRNASDVAARLAEGDVLLHRRDGEDVRLTLEARAHAEPSAVGLFARLVEAALKEPGGAALFTRQLSAAIPWARFLPAQDRTEFLGELAECAEACAAVGVWVPLEQLVREWQSTAAVYADPNTLALLRRDHTGDLGPVRPPGEGVPRAAEAR